MAIIDKKTNEYSAAYSDYYPLLYSIVYSKLGNVDDTEDICQEAFLLFFDKYDDIENHRGWLLTTVNFLIQNFYRKKSGKEFNIEDPSSDSTLTFENGARDIRLIIEEAIENMDNFEDERDRILFDLIAIYKYKYREAGKLLGISVRQVRYKYDRIKKNLMLYLKGKGIGSLEDLL